MFDVAYTNVTRTTTRCYNYVAKPNDETIDVVKKLLKRIRSENAKKAVLTTSKKLIRRWQT